jgi:hypothetical protein
MTAESTARVYCRIPCFLFYTVTSYFIFCVTCVLKATKGRRRCDVEGLTGETAVQHHGWHAQVTPLCLLQQQAAARKPLSSPPANRR